MAKILVVEDDKILSDAYVMILEREGHDVSTAFNGREALDRAAADEPEIILLDLLMPVMSGIEFLEKFELKKNHPLTKVVILSNLGDEKEIDKAMKFGAYKYVIKAHASPDELSVLVNHLIAHNLQKKKSVKPKSK